MNTCVGNHMVRTRRSGDAAGNSSATAPPARMQSPIANAQMRMRMRKYAISNRKCANAHANATICANAYAHANAQMRKRRRCASACKCAIACAHTFERIANAQMRISAICANAHPHANARLHMRICLRVLYYINTHKLEMPAVSSGPVCTYIQVCTVPVAA